MGDYKVAGVNREGLSNVVIVKNLAGSYSNEKIGHEIINEFKDDNGNINIYVPAYGVLGSKNARKKFITNEYKAVNYILFFDKTPFSSILKLKSIAYIDDDDKFTEPDYDKRNEEIKKVTYGGASILDIFKDIDENEVDGKISLITYKVRDKNYFDLKDNIYLIQDKKGVIDVDKNDKVEKNKISFDNYIELIHKNKSTIKTKENNKFFIKPKEELLIFKNSYIAETNYRYIKDEYFIEWINNLFKNKKMYLEQKKVNKIDKNEVNKIASCNNILKYLEMENYENLYTNFIVSVLKDSDKSLTLNFAKNLTGNESLANKGCNIVRKQVYTKTETKGVIDIYIEGNNYRIVIENKIKSALNGKYIDNNTGEPKDQIDKYISYLESLNELEQKNNYIFVLTPDYNSSIYPEEKNYSFCGKTITAKRILYSNILKFFNSNKKLILNYKDEFLYCLELHSFNNEDRTKREFKMAIRNALK